MRFILSAHPVRGDSHIQRNANREVATTLGPVMLINRKFDISCKLDISRNLSRVLVRVNCIKKQAEVLPYSPVPTERGLWWA